VMPLDGLTLVLPAAGLIAIPVDGGFGECDVAL
jgi:hypothetical protein